jgi:hypothetical protein
MATKESRFRVYQAPPGVSGRELIQERESEAPRGNIGQAAISRSWNRQTAFFL